MEQKFSEEIILSDFDVDNQVVLTPFLESCQNSNVWPYCQNVLFKSFPMEEEIVEEQELEDAIIFNSDSIGSLPELATVDCDSSPMQETVTHIEIIKARSAGPRRVPGASRVVPSLTSSWQRSNFAASEPSITDVYSQFMAGQDETGGGPRCPECLHDFLSAAELACHVRLHHPDVPLAPEYCFVCRKMFLFTPQLADHLSTYHGIQCPDVMCKICFMELRSPAELRAHERKHAKDFACPRCPLKFASEHAYQTHWDVHARALKPHECATCGKRFASDISRSVHGNRHSRLSCLSCDLVFREERLYLSHIKAHAPGAVTHLLARTAALDAEEDKLDGLLQAYHNHDRTQDRRPDDDDAVAGCVASLVRAVSLSSTSASLEVASLALQCRLCRAGAATPAALVEHHAEKHARSRTCPFCRALSASLSALRRHVAGHVKRSRSDEVAGRTRTLPANACADCGKIVASKAALRKHRAAAHETIAVACDDCDRCFDSAALLAKHVRSAHGSQSANIPQSANTAQPEPQSVLACSVCAKTFVRGAFLTRHMASDHGTHTCRHCAESFDSKVALRRHEERHKPATARQRFACPRCPVRCSTRSGLRVHTRTHTDERPYACLSCAKTFRRPQALVKHKRTVHDDAPKHPCADCPLSFRERANLVRHFLRVHRRLRRFVCGFCAERFTHNQDLHRHLRSRHDADAPVLRGEAKKSLREIYVVPPLGSVEVAAEMAAKIGRVVEKENAKFEGFAERFDGDAANTVGRLLHNDLPDDSEGCEPEVQSEVDCRTEVESRTELEGQTAPSHEPGLQPRPSAFIALLSVPRLFRCDHCQTLFCLETHLAEHTARRRDNECPICAAQFCAPAVLRDHVAQTHAPPAVRYRCGICAVDFAAKDALTGHLSLAHGADVTFDIDVDAECAEAGHLALPPRIPVTVREISRRMDASPPCADEAAGHGLASLVSNEVLLISSDVQPISSDIQSVSSVIQPVSNDLQLDTSYVQPVSSNFLPVSSRIQPVSSNFLPVSSGIQSVSNDLPLITSGIQPVSHEVQPILNEVQPILNEAQPVPEPTDTDIDADAAKKLTCAQCGKRFPEIGRLIRHINTHLGVRAHGCPHCPKRFAEKHNLAVHQRSHTQERPYACGECGAQLRYRKEVADHAARHRGQKPHACTQCDRTFLRSGELARHARTHSLVKNFVCPVCSKSFRRADELRVHGRVHADGAGPAFACPVCAKSFAARDKLRQHAACHAPRDAFVCHICGKTFALELYLKSHLKTHAHRETYLHCPKCARMFSSEENLEIHLTKFHAKIAKKGRANSQGKKEDMPTVADPQEEDLNCGADGVTELEVTEMEIQDELLPSADSETTGQMIYFHADSAEAEPTFIYISSVE